MLHACIVINIRYEFIVVHRMTKKIVRNCEMKTHKNIENEQTSPRMNGTERTMLNRFTFQANKVSFHVECVTKQHKFCGIF